MRPFVALVTWLLIAGCSRTEPVAEPLPGKASESASPAPLKVYELRGEVVSLDENGKIAKIKHGQIGDWMGPMTMEFPVKDESEFRKLKAGQPIRGKVNVQDFSYWVSDVDASPAAAK